MINHLIHSNRERSHVAAHHIRSTIAHEYDINAGTIDNARRRIIIRGQHRDFSAAGLHFFQTFCRHLAVIIIQISSHD